MVEWFSDGPLRIVSDYPGRQTKIAAITKNRKFGKKSLKNYLLLGRLGPNYGGMVFRWSSSRIVSNDPGRR
jgi:hypothetical protein